MDIAQGETGDGYLGKGLEEDAVIAAVGLDVFDGDVPEHGQAVPVSSVLIEHGAMNRCAVHRVHYAV